MQQILFLVHSRISIATFSCALFFNKKRNKASRSIASCNQRNQISPNFALFNSRYVLWAEIAAICKRRKLDV